MPRLPAFCESCGAVFASPLRASTPGEENAFDVPVPCPVCEGSGRVPGELLQVCADAARLFADRDPDQVEEFLDLLSRPPDGSGPAARDELLSRTARRAPDFVEVARRLLPGPRPLVRGLGRLLERVREAARGGSDPRSAALRAVDEHLAEEAVESDAPDVPEAVAAARRRLRRTGRNDPCPCGSGDKYKSCHWVPDLRTTRS